VTPSSTGPGGARLVVEESHDLPLVHVQVVLRAGGAEDPEGRDGLTNFATELMARGTARRGRAELDAAFDALGGGLEIATDHDSATFGLTVLRSHLDRALALLAEVLLEPRFPADEADKLKRELIAQLDELRDDDGRLARRYFMRALFGNHPYGRSLLGHAASIGALDAAQAAAWHARAIVGGNLIFGLAGDIRPAQAAAALTRHFAALPAGPPPGRDDYPTPPRRRGRRLTLVDKPERTQSQILIGQPGPRWRDPDYMPLHVAATAFGGTFTSRLMDEVRVKRGLSYGASARVAAGRGEKAILLHVFPSLEQTAETLRLVLDLYSGLASDGLPARELDFARGYLAGSFGFHVATPEDRLDLAAAVELMGLPGDYVSRYGEHIRAVGAAEVARAMAAWVRPEHLEVCVVSTADELRPRLADAGLLEGVELEVVPFDSF
jgi:zinc protease